MKWLMLAGLPFVCLEVICLVGLAMGVQWGDLGLWRDHGITMAVLLFVVIFGGAAVELFLVPISLLRLVRFPALRTLRNLGAVLFGIAYFGMAVAVVA